jgi:hypothetical protein
MRTAVANAPIYAAIPREWPGSTIVCLATGPSLTQQDVDFCRDKAKVIAIKNAYDLAPWADVVYGAGVDVTRWWQVNGDRVVANHAGLRFTLDPLASKWATLLRYGAEHGLSADPSRLALGRNSGYQVINLAVLLGAAKIILLGYDMRVGSRNNFFEGPMKGPAHKYSDWQPFFASIVEPLKQLGVAVINCTPNSALECFPKMTLAEALS